MWVIVKELGRVKIYSETYLSLKIISFSGDLQYFIIVFMLLQSFSHIKLLCLLAATALYEFLLIQYFTFISLISQGQCTLINIYVNAPVLAE